MQRFANLSILALAVAASAISHADITPHLKYGKPACVGLNPEPLKDMVKNLTAYTEVGGDVRPLEPGSTNIVARNGVIVSEFAIGKSYLWADVNGTLLPDEKQEDVTINTIYDMASVSKLFA